jgi:hypothetical protein
MGDREWGKRLQFIGVPSLSQLSPLNSRPFPSPEGDSCLCYMKNGTFYRQDLEVSVPRRGFLSLLLAEAARAAPANPSFRPPKGILVFATRSGRSRSGIPDHVSVPRRGFLSLLPVDEHTAKKSAPMFPSPEGDSCLCYSTYSSKIGCSCHLATTFPHVYGP